VKNEEEAFGAINIWNVKNKQQEGGIDINTRERQRERSDLIRSDLRERESGLDYCLHCCVV